MNRYRIAVIPGDNIGPEVIAQGLRVLRRAEELGYVRDLLSDFGGAERAKESDKNLIAPEKWKIGFAGYVVRTVAQHLQNNVSLAENGGAVGNDRSQGRRHPFDEHFEQGIRGGPVCRGRPQQRKKRSLRTPHGDEHR